MDIKSVIRRALAQKRIMLEKKSLKELDSRGFMSRIFYAHSTMGDVIIHVLSPVDEQRIQKTHNKIMLIGKMLENHPDIPTARVFAYGSLTRDTVFTVQSCIEGRPLGNRVIKKNTIVGRYFYSKTKHLPGVLRLIARIHKIPLKKYGYFKITKKHLEGTYPTWQSFLETESKRWIHVLLKTAKKNDLPFLKKIQTTIPAILKKYKKKLNIKSPRLIHGDMINPGNILINKERISGIIDFEWALSGDPAWEFAFTNDGPLKTYFDERKKHERIDEPAFLFRTRLYSILWLTWAASVHANGGPLKKILMRKLKDRLISFEQELAESTIVRV